MQFFSVLFQPLHLLFVKVDVNLFVIINILFVWFVCFLVECSTLVNVRQAWNSYNHNRKHCLLRNLIVSCLFVLEDVL